MNLYLKYRPTTLDQIKGNSDLVETLNAKLSDVETCNHVFMLHGQTGCGKTTIARIIADRLGCKGQDFREVNSADFRGIDTIRDMISQSKFRPIEGRCRVWLIDEAHKLTGDAQNAMLKILEDTPPHVYFIICTTEPQKLISTIHGRCLKFQVMPLDETIMYRLLRQVVKEEGQSLEREVYDQIIQDSLGLPRNALQILDQVLTAAPERRLEIARQTAERQSQTIELCRALMGKTGWKEIARILTGLKEQEPESIRRAVLGYCQAILLNGENIRAGIILDEFIRPFFDSGFPQLVLACYTVYNEK